VAGQAAVALVNALTFSEATAASDEIGALCARLEAAPEALGRVAEADDLTASLEAAAEAACRLFGGTSCVVSAGGRSIGYDGGAAAPGAGSERQLYVSAVGAAEVLTATAAAGGGELRITLSLPRAARRGEAQLLGVLARTTGLLVGRLPR
jgi:hypothetical protein